MHWSHPLPVPGLPNINLLNWRYDRVKQTTALIPFHVCAGPRTAVSPPKEERHHLATEEDQRTGLMLGWQQCPHGLSHHGIWGNRRCELRLQHDTHLGMQKHASIMIIYISISNIHTCLVVLACRCSRRGGSSRDEG